MRTSARTTIIVANGTAMRACRLELARQGRHGVDVRTIEQAACRLVGGFVEPIDGDTLTAATAAALCDVPAANLGDLAAIVSLPGLPGALAATLRKVWAAGLDLGSLAAERPGVLRLAVLARLEAAVLSLLPPTMVRPADLADQAMGRLHHAPAVLGTVECGVLLHVVPCWHKVLDALGAAPGWWRPVEADARGIDPRTGAVPRVVTCATARHEVIEAMRWARSLLATGNVQAQEIAFAAASPGEYDDLVLAMAAEASLDVHFAHGRRALATRDGQAAAALADIVLNGLSHDRVRRLARLAYHAGSPFGQMSVGWIRRLPAAAPLGTRERWHQAASALEASDRAVLLPAIDLLSVGPDRAGEIGSAFLDGMARHLWHRALQRAPATALEATLGSLRLPDGTEPASSIAWMHAESLAACSRPHVWLFGLNARTWPRASSEDPLLPDHILPSAELEPVSVTRLDRMVFHAIRAGTSDTLVCSASRRDATGRLIGLSPLLPHGQEPERLRRARIPAHAMSEQDRLMARPTEFAGSLRAQSAVACWLDWNTQGITPHDGRVRADHPLLRHAVDRIQSASSLKALLRNPLGFTWQYALRWREPDLTAEAMTLDALAFGNLVHALLDSALPAIEAAGGLGRAGEAAIQQAVARARQVVSADWEREVPVPPRLLWLQTLDQAETMANTALCWPLEALAGQSSHGEIAFGDPEAAGGGGPWDGARPVTIPGTPIRIRGRIDRLDLSADRARARVVDYKTGRPGDPGVLNGGSELQRCLYAFAVQSLLGADVEVEATLLYPRGEDHPLTNTADALGVLTAALLTARESLLAGRALPGPDTGGGFDKFAFALPAKPGSAADRKLTAATAELGDAALIWEQP